MKLADYDWESVLRHAPRWSGLSVAARRAFLHVRPGAAAPPELLGGAVDELVAAGFVSPPGPRGMHYPHAPELRPLLTAFRAMHRHPVLHRPDDETLVGYLQDQFADYEANALAGGDSYRFWTTRETVVATISSLDWVTGFLEAAATVRAAQWEQAHMRRNGAHLLGSRATARALYTLVRALTTRPGGARLAELAELLPEEEPEVRADAVKAGLRYALVFGSIDSVTIEPVLGLLPGIVRRLGPPPPPPVPVEVTASFEAAFRIADMTAVLVEAAAEPIPMRGGDGGLYVRSLRALVPRLMPLPEWGWFFLSGGPASTPPEPASAEQAELRAEMRVTFAVLTLRVLGLGDVVSSADRHHFSATRAGRAWLALAEEARLKHALDAMRAAPQRNPGAASLTGDEMDFFGTRLSFSLPRDLDLRTPLTEAFLALAPDRWYDVETFARYHGEVANPLLAAGIPPARSPYGYSPAPRTREEWEDLWLRIVTEFLRVRLLPFGGARIGAGSAGLAFTLTDVGRYLLGASKTFALAPQAEGEVVVNPDFEIVFLAPAPRLEAEFGRFAERVGSGVGTLFRLTKASVLRAAEQGLAADALLKTLGSASRSAVPANVSRQVRDWMGATRRVRIRPAVLVECPDTETAARVTALAGANATAITRTILRLEGDPRFIAALTKKLRAQGIFVQN
ncbi:MAG TPA: helicase-associated domain-containing protein [Longimicrobium sp.]|jgi:hypothetical protein|uniref:helicase-associated domain-containing protein n=1 Tax=Longimicrobium sp. TaxID=2029185 RepID=UPI002EDA5350